MADTERLSPQEVEIQGLLESAKDDPILSVQLQERLKDAKIDRLEAEINRLRKEIERLENRPLMRELAKRYLESTE